VAEFKNLPENLTPSGSDLLAVAQDSDDATVKVQLDNLPIVTELASTANGNGASKVSIEDSAAYFSSTTVEGALAELYIQMDGLDEWVSTTSYAIGDVIWLSTNNVVYRCLTANSDVTFTDVNWQSVGKDRFSTVSDTITGSNQTVTSITSEVIRLTNAGLVSIDMIPQGIGQQLFLLNNTGSSILINDETGATTNQRIKTGLGSSIELPDNQALHVVYDELESRWQVIGFQEIGNATKIQGVDVHTVAPTDGQVLVYSNANSRWEAQSSAAGGNSIAVIWDEKASGVDSGDFNSGAWRTRDINTESDPDNIVTISSNQFDLEIGDYIIDWSAPVYDILAGHKTRLQNIDDATTEGHGSTEYSGGSSGGTSTRSFGSVHISIAATKTFEIQHRCTVTNTVDGFGKTSGFSSAEVYTIVRITKL